MNNQAPQPTIPKDDETEAEQLEKLYGPGTLVLDSHDIGMYALRDYGIGIRDDES